MIDRISSLEENSDDRISEIRPKTFEEFLGQESIKENTQVYIQAALQRNDVLDHILLSGPPGLGKTTFSMIIARSMGANLKATSAPVIEKTGDIAAILSSLKERDILFIDEIHRLKPVVEEMLYSAMEDGFLDLNLGQGNTAKTVKISLPPFTLVGATTKPGFLTQPLLSRFGILHRFDFYTQEDLRKIGSMNALKLNININDQAVAEIAKRSRGTPRILNRLLKRVRDFAEVKNKGVIDSRLVDYSLEQMDIDRWGLDDMDRRIITTLIEHFSGGPVGLENLAVSLGEDAQNIEDVYEPYLIQLGFIKRTSRGRLATSKAYQYLGREDHRINTTDSETSLFS